MKFQTIRPRLSLSINGSNDSLNRMTRKPSLDISVKPPNHIDTTELVIKSKPLVINVVRNNTVSSLTDMIIPDIYGMLVSTVLCYVAQNYNIVKRKPCVLLHPKKILSAMPLSVAGVLLDSVITNKVDGIESNTMHMAAHVVLQTLKLSLMAL